MRDDSAPGASETPHPFAGLHGGPAIWLARGLAISGLFLGLTRLAVAVEAGPYRASQIRRTGRTGQTGQTSDG